MGKKEIFLEEAVLDDLSEGLEVVEKPLREKLFRLIGWLTALVVLISLFRTFYINVFLGNDYQMRALANSGQQMILKAPRGIIYDRYEKILVNNRPGFDIVLNLSQILKDKENIDSVLKKISDVVPFNVEESKNLIFSVNLEKQAYFLLVRDISVSQTIELKKMEVPGIIIESNFSRQYFGGESFAHLLGYTGLVDRDDLERDKNLKLNDEIGKSGLEFFYDDFLRGEDGVSLAYQDALGEVLEEKTVNVPLAGKNIQTTVDADLQQFFFETLKNQIRSLGAAAGAGLVIDPASGQILSLVSFPSFDNNNLKSEIFTDESRPTFNRVVSGIYSPGSTIKPLVAFAALEEGVLDPLFSIFSAGYIEIPNPYFPDQPSRFVDWKPHGWVNLYSALARSSNVYFYEVGGGYGSLKGLGIERLKDYWEKFLLDKKTGIDLPSEKSGTLADPEEKEKRTGQIWRIGDTYNVSIGQGDLTITPLELLRYIVGIHRKGKLPVPFVVENIKDVSGKIVYSREPKFDEMNFKDVKNFEEVEAGMIDAVEKSYGTANSLSDLPLKIAAKTGSAQIENNTKVNAFFVGYNFPPAEATQTDLEENQHESVKSVLSASEVSSGSQSESAPKQIAVLVLIEDAREGSLNAIPVAKEVFEWYYNNRIKTQN